MLALATFGLGGSIFLAYTSFSITHGPSFVAASASTVPVYSARAVPFDPPVTKTQRKAVSVAQTVAMARAESARTLPAESNQAVEDSLLPSVPSGDLKGFHGFSSFNAGNVYLTLTATTFGMSAQTNAPSYMGADVEMDSVAPVPEASTWLCGVALAALVGARGLRAKWHRSRRRSENAASLSAVALRS